MDFSKSGISLDLEKLSDGIVLDLDKTNGAPLKRVRFGLAWQPVMAGDAVDLDVMGIIERQNGKPADANDIIWYNMQPTAECTKWINYSGDDRDGSGSDGDEDDEFIDIDFTKIPPYVKSIRLLVTIYDAKAKQQTLATADSHVKILDADTNRLIKDYYLNREDNLQFSTGVDLGKFERTQNGWVFKGRGEGFDGNLNDVLKGY